MDFWDWMDLYTDIKNNPNDFLVRLMKAYIRGKINLRQLEEYNALVGEVLDHYWRTHTNVIEHSHWINAEVKDAEEEKEEGLPYHQG
jgi:hypothetical protein